MATNNNLDFFEKGSRIEINTRVWMRPKTACEVLRKRGIRVSPALMNYWINEGKITSKKIKGLDELTIVNIETIPEEMRIATKIPK